jgi:hypothetical protein
MSEQQNIKLTADEREFFNNFVVAHVAPHSTQTPEQAQERGWIHFHYPTNDKLIKAHLDGKQSIALPPRWYPLYANIDIDSPKTQAEAVFDKLDELQIRADQYLITATPRHRKNGNFRINFKLEMNSEPATTGLQNIVLRRHFNFHNVETNPRPNVSDRLVCGFNSEFLDLQTRADLGLDLRGKLDALRNLRPIEITDLPRIQAELPGIAEVNEQHLKTGSTFLKEGKELLENGLQSGDYNRHDAQHRVIFLLWKRGNHNPEQTAELVKTWIREKHNGHSDAVNIGDWTRIDAEINRQVKSVFKLIANRLPDAPHNRTVEVTRADVLMAAKFAPGNVVKQKQFFNLIKIIRPNFHWKWILIHSKKWIHQIASDSTYKKLKKELQSKGLMQIDRRYIVNSESQKYKFNFQLGSGEPLTDADGKHIANYEEAVVTVFNNNRREIKAATGISDSTLDRYLGKAKI